MKTIAHTPGLLVKALAEEMPEGEYATTAVPAAWFGSKGVISFAKGPVNGLWFKASPQMVDQN